jgi:hypothetical protein
LHEAPAAPGLLEGGGNLTGRTFGATAAECSSSPPAPPPAADVAALDRRDI